MICYEESQLISVFLWGVVSMCFGVILGWYITYKVFEKSGSSGE